MYKTDNIIIQMLSLIHIMKLSVFRRFVTDFKNIQDLVTFMDDV